MKINFILKEALSSILFHHTNIKKLSSILLENKFRLSTSLGSVEDNLDYSSHYYLSLSRSKHGGYSREKNSIGEVKLVIDGDLLNKRFRGKPVNYWKNERYKNIDNTDEFLTYSETEDRLYHSEPVIENARKYIKEVHILTNNIFKGYIDNEPSFKKYDDEVKKHYYQIGDRIKAIIKICDLNNIPVYLYSNVNDFITLNKNKSFYLDIKKSDLESLIDILTLSKDEWDNPTKNFHLELIEGDKEDLIKNIKNEINGFKDSDIGRRVIEKFSRAAMSKKKYIKKQKIGVEEVVDYILSKEQNETK